MRRVPDIPLPTHAHVPGTGTSADIGPLNQAKAMAPAVTLADGWQENKAYLYGHDLMSAGFFWEAHEVWEAVWLVAPANSAERVLLQALIQRTNALLKHKMGRPNAGKRLDAMVETLMLDLASRLPAQKKSFMGVSLETRIMNYNS
ncbi:MAG: DUF309 domain-containing protein [Anderseniella sp.]